MQTINRCKLEAKKLRNRSRRAAADGDPRMAQVWAELARSAGRRSRDHLDDYQRVLDLQWARILDLLREYPMLPI